MPVKELFRPSLHYPVHAYSAMLTGTAQRFPENEAIIFKDDNLSYRELDGLVNAFANALLALGIRKGQVLCLFMTNRPAYVISWFAAARIGAIVSPINPSYKEREVAYQLQVHPLRSDLLQRVVRLSFHGPSSFRFHSRSHVARH